MKNKLRSPENLSGILNWCLDGLRKFHTEGLKPTTAIIEATADYRQESDKVGKFLAECLEPANENMMAGTAYESMSNGAEPAVMAVRTKGTSLQNSGQRTL